MVKLLIAGAAITSLFAAAYGLQETEAECGKPPAQAGEKAATIKTLQVDEVDKLLTASPRPFVYDANPIEIYRDGHVPGAKWVDFSRVTADALPADKSAMLIFYCYNEMCGASPAAAKAAVSLGWRNVYLMSGGISGWKKANKSIERN